MRDTIAQSTDAWTCSQLVARHEQMHVAIRTRQGCTTVLQPTTGGAQGDKVMPIQFHRAYEDKLEQWNKLLFCLKGSR